MSIRPICQLELWACVDLGICEDVHRHYPLFHCHAQASRVWALRPIRWSLNSWATSWVVFSRIHIPDRLDDLGYDEELIPGGEHRYSDLLAGRPIIMLASTSCFRDHEDSILFSWVLLAAHMQVGALSRLLWRLMDVRQVQFRDGTACSFCAGVLIRINERIHVHCDDLAWNNQSRLTTTALSTLNLTSWLE